MNLWKADPALIRPWDGDDGAFAHLVRSDGVLLRVLCTDLPFHQIFVRDRWVVLVMTLPTDVDGYRVRVSACLAAFERLKALTESQSELQRRNGGSQQDDVATSSVARFYDKQNIVSSLPMSNGSRIVLCNNRHAALDSYFEDEYVFPIYRVDCEGKVIWRLRIDGTDPRDGTAMAHPVNKLARIADGEYIASSPSGYRLRINSDTGIARLLTEAS